MKKLIYIYIILGLAAVTGCRRFDVDEILLERDDLSLTVKGELMFSYDPLTCQTSQNVTENEYRLFDDDLRKEENHLLTKLHPRTFPSFP